MAGFFDALKLLLPGVFADRDHWRERALNAEARLSELVSQVDAVMARERAEWRSERAELMGRLRGEISLPPLPDDDGRNGRASPPVPRANPIARAYDAAKKAAEEAVPDELVGQIVDDYLRMNAANNSDNHNDRGK